MRNHPPRSLYIAGLSGRGIEQSRSHGLGLSTGGGASSLLNNLVSYWTLDEFSDASGPVTRLDSVVASGNDLTDNNTCASTAGVISNGVSFVKVNTEYLNHVSNTSLNMDNTSFEITGWVKGTTFTSFVLDAIISKYPISGAYLIAVTNGTLQFIATRASDSVDVTVSWGLVSAGSWIWFDCWYDQTNNLIGIAANNGIPVTAAMSSSVRTNADPLFIGSRSTIDGYLNGVVDEVGVWKTVLTAAQRTSLYNAGVGRTYPFIGAP